MKFLTCVVFTSPRYRTLTVLLTVSLFAVQSAHSQLLPAAPKKPVVEEKKPAPKPVVQPKKVVQSPAVKKDTVAADKSKPVVTQQPIEEKKIESPAVITKIPVSSAVPIIPESYPTTIEFIEEFNDNSFGWYNNSDKDHDIKVENGKYRFSSKKDNSSWFASRLIDLNPEKDFSISVIAKWQEGIENNRFGIQFCSDRNGDNYMFFGVSANGYYIIADYKGGKWYPMKDWTQTDRVNKKYVPNLLTIKKEGRFISYYLNDQMVFSMPFEGGYGRAFGFRLHDKQTVEFDRLEIKGTRYLLPSKEGLVKTEPLLNDPFNMNNGWSLFTDSDKTMYVSDGKLQFTGINKDKTFWTTRSFPVDLNGSFSISAKVKWVSGINNNAIGFAYGSDASMTSNNYFGISSNGYYVLWMYTNGEFKKIIPWTTTPLVKQGNQENEIELRKIGKDLEIYINGKMVDKINCPQLYGNYFGPRLTSAQRVEFDDFIVREFK